MAAGSLGKHASGSAGKGLAAAALGAGVGAPLLLVGCQLVKTMHLVKEIAHCCEKDPTYKASYYRWGLPLPKRHHSWWHNQTGGAQRSEGKTQRLPDQTVIHCHVEKLPHDKDSLLDVVQALLGHICRQPGRVLNQSIQSITFKVHGEPAWVSWDWAGGEGCVSGVHSIGRGTVRCGRRLAGPARPVGWKLRAGISVRSGCGGWCRGGIERGCVPRLLWEQGNGGSAGHVPVGQWLPRGRWGRSDRGGTCGAKPVTGWGLWEGRV